GLADGPRGSTGPDQSTGAARSDAGAGVFLRTTPRGLAPRRGNLAAGATAISGGRTRVSTGPSPTGDLPLQACTDSGCSLSVTAQESPPAVSQTNCLRLGRAVCRDQRDPARAPCSSLHPGQLDSTGHLLLASGREESQPTL